MNTIYVCGYMGLSFTSRQIECWTRSEYSHVSLYFPALHREWEAWEKTGCGWVDGLGKQHDPRTVIDLFKWELDDEDYNYVIEWCNENDGLDYDKPGILGFILRRRMDREDAWFCSEALVEVGLGTKRPLLTPPDSSLVTPGEALWSPIIKHTFRTRAGRVPDGLFAGN
jgi:hypothetical protein